MKKVQLKEFTVGQYTNGSLKILLFWYLYILNDILKKDQSIIVQIFTNLNELVSNGHAVLLFGIEKVKNKLLSRYLLFKHYLNMHNQFQAA